MVRIFYAPPKELEISGTVKALHDIREALMALARGEESAASIQADASADPEPYDQAIGLLNLKVADGPIRVFVSTRGMEVEGSKESFDVFASFFDFHEDAKPGTHYHHDSLGNEGYVHPDSIPLVVAIRA